MASSETGIQAKDLANNLGAALHAAGVIDEPVAVGHPLEAASRELT